MNHTSHHAMPGDLENQPPHSAQDPPTLIGACGAAARRRSSPASAASPSSPAPTCARTPSAAQAREGAPVQAQALALALALVDHGLQARRPILRQTPPTRIVQPITSRRTIRTLHTIAIRIPCTLTLPRRRARAWRRRQQARPFPRSTPRRRCARRCSLRSRKRSRSTASGGVLACSVMGLGNMRLLSS